MKQRLIEIIKVLKEVIKETNLNITDNTLKDFLWALESSTVVDFDGTISQCIVKLKLLLNTQN